MKISIVTISFNQAEFLERAIKSVVEQDYDDIEYIVVDPGSTDGSREIIERYKDQIDHIIYEPDNGPSDGLNNGFRVATGDIYGYLNADDTFEPGVLRRVSSLFDADDRVDVFSAHGYLVDKDDVILQKIFSAQFILMQYLAGCCAVVQQSSFFKAGIFKKVGGFNQANRIHWDGELMVDFAVAGARFKVIHEYWSCWRVYGESISGSGEHYELFVKENERIMQKILPQGISSLKRRAYWVVSKLCNPRATFLRFIDGLVHRKRVKFY